MAEKTCLFGQLAFNFSTKKRPVSPGMQGEPKYEITLLMDPQLPALAGYQAACLRVMAAKLNGETDKAKAALKAKPAIKRGDDREDPPEGFAGKVYICARSDRMPDFWSADRRRLSAEEAEQLFYSGCMINAIVSPWAFARNGNKGVSHELIAIQFAGHGKAFSGRQTSCADDLPDMSEQAAASSQSSVQDLL